MYIIFNNSGRIASTYSITKYMDISNVQPAQKKKKKSLIICYPRIERIPYSQSQDYKKTPYAETNRIWGA